MQCTFGAAPSALVVLPIHRVLTQTPDANINDHVPLVNIMPFGVCSAPSFPATASATAAASGVLTPMPCVPLTPSPWAVGAVNVILDGAPALDNISKLICTWGGVISFVDAGQVTVFIP